MPDYSRYNYTIAPKDAVTIHFNDTTPDLVCTYQQVVSDTGTLIVTTPQGELDPALTTVYFVDDFQYLSKAPPAP